MQNITLARKQPPRSVESLIEDSSLDRDQFNYEANEIRRTYNDAVKQHKFREAESRKQLQRHTIQLKSYEESIKAKEQLVQQKELQIRRLNSQAQQQKHNSGELQKLYDQCKRRLSYVERKLQTIMENRVMVQAAEAMDSRLDTVREAIQLGEFKTLLRERVADFVEQLKQYVISPIVEKRLEAFFEELLYLSPKPTIGDDMKPVGMIKVSRRGRWGQEQMVENSQASDNSKKNSDQELRRLEKSLDRLKSVSAKKYAQSRKQEPSPAKNQLRRRIFEGTA